MNGLILKTDLLFDKVSKLNCIKPYLLSGGTALALQLHHRKSEDLDFMKWRGSKDEKMEVEWRAIEKELSEIGELQKTDILDIDHVEFLLSAVKLSFYACRKYAPVKCPVDFQNNIKLADMPAIMSMKMEVLMRRSAFRDYYDIYAMLKSGLDISESIAKAIEYSGHKLKTKNLLSMLTNGERFRIDAGFSALEPAFDVTPAEIESYIKACLKVSTRL